MPFQAVPWRLARAAVTVALLLSAIEAIQIQFPGGVPEIMNYLLALTLEVTLGLSERLQNPAGNSVSR